MLAFEAAADPAKYPEAGPPHRVEAVYHPAFTAGLLKVIVRLMPLFGRDPRRFGRNHDIDLLQVISWEAPAHVRIDISRYLEVKQRASACHRSQARPGGMFRWLPGFIARRMNGAESLTQAIPAPGRRVRHDLFWV